MSGPFLMHIIKALVQLLLIGQSIEFFVEILEALCVMPIVFL